MHILFNSHQFPKRYLTLFYGLTLGLALILAVMAGFGVGKDKPAEISPTQPVYSQSPPPTSMGSPVPVVTTPTSLPDILSTPDESTPSPLGVTAAQLSGARITVWSPWAGRVGEILQTMLDEFNRSNPWGITAQASTYEGFGSLDDAMETALTTGPLPDVVLDYGYQAQHWYSSNILVDLNPYVDDPVWGMNNAEQTDFYPTFWEEDLAIASTQGQPARLGIPYYRSAYLLFYNRSWAQELGYTSPPATPEDFRLQACAAAESITQQGDRTSLGKGGWLITLQPGGLMGWIDAFGGVITDEGGLGYTFNTPEIVLAFEYLKSLQESGCAWPATDADAGNEFASRHALFLVGGLYDITSQQQAFDRAGNKDEWLVIPFPSKSQHVVDTYGPSWMVSRSTPVQQLASWLVIKWLLQPTYQAQWVGTLRVYPTRQSTASILIATDSTSSHWIQALQLLPVARGEPTLTSWRIVRWTLADAMSQLFDSQFDATQIPSLLEILDSVAAEIILQVH